MNSSFEQTLIEVWRQALIENAKVVVLGTERYPVRQTPKRSLRQVDFVFDGNEIRGLEQNPETKSRWAQMARSGKKVMQFLSGPQLRQSNSELFSLPLKLFDSLFAGVAEVNDTFGQSIFFSLSFCGQLFIT